MHRMGGHIMSMRSDFGEHADLGRVRAMSSTSQYLFGPFRLDSANAQLWRGEQTLALTPKAFAVLVYLVEHPDQLVTKDALLDVIWAGTAVSDGVLKTCIREIRSVLGDAARSPQCI